jgi:GTPase SAR1 family protein
MDGGQFLYDVFISYSRADRAWVRGWLLPRLQTAGLSVCIDDRDFGIGVPSIINMEAAVIQSRHTLLVLTPAWVASEWTALEALLTLAVDPIGRQQRLLPLLLKPCQPPLRIAYLSYADFSDPQQHPSQLRRLLATLQGCVRPADLGPTLQRLLPDDLLTPDQRNRRAMIRKVRLTWIAGVLDRSITTDTRIVLGLQNRPDAVIDPIDLVVQRPNRRPEPLRPGTAIIDVYDQLMSALLILGAPGAGKTTLLLELARDLLDRAERDPQHPIPLIFPLSTWAERRRPLERWVVDELVLRYQVSRGLAQAWLDDNAIMPLLDGLDEVAVDCRNACADAINCYRQTRGTQPLVVCSRIADYEALTTRLQLHGAIVAQPLSRDQVRAYLRAVGIPAIPTSRSPLWELLDTPLMLSVATLVYAGRPFNALADDDPIVARDQLFAAYIDRMLTRNVARPPFTDEQTRHTLAFLACQMARRNQTTLYLEHLQPDWLPASERWRWRMLVALITMAAGASVGGLLGGLVYGLALGPHSTPGGALVFGLVGGLIGGLRSRPSDSIQPTEVVHWSWRHARSSIFDNLHAILIVGLGMALGVALVFGLVFGWNAELVSAAVGEVVSEVVVALIVALVVGLVFTLLFGLVFSLAFGLFDLVTRGLSEQTIAYKTAPNQGIRRSGLNGILVGLVFGLVFGLAGGLVFGLAGGMIVVLGDGLRSALAGGLLFGLAGGLIGGLQYGGRAYLQHYALRLLLIRNGSIPARLVPFLDYATQRIFLRRVGGAYLFIHRLLLEHFAAQRQAPDAAGQRVAERNALKRGGMPRDG